MVTMKSLRTRLSESIGVETHSVFVSNRIYEIALNVFAQRKIKIEKRKKEKGGKRFVRKR